jgi:hypothetical protein
MPEEASPEAGECWEGSFADDPYEVADLVAGTRQGLCS